MGYKDDGRSYNWPAPGELINHEVEKYIRWDEPFILSGGRIQPHTMHRDMVPASFLIPSRLGNDQKGVILNFRTIDGKVNPWAEPYGWFNKNQGREAVGSLKRVENGHQLWQLNISAGRDVEPITIKFDKAPKESSEGLFVFNVAEFRPAKR